MRNGSGWWGLLSLCTSLSGCFTPTRDDEDVIPADDGGCHGDSGTDDGLWGSSCAGRRQMPVDVRLGGIGGAEWKWGDEGLAAGGLNLSE